MQVRLLGELVVDDHGVDVTPRGRKQRLLIACLALHPGEVVSIDRLAEVLWGDSPPANPANAIQAQVASLRRTLPAGALITRGAGYALDVGPDDVDVSWFEARLAEGRRLLSVGRHRDAVGVLGGALDAWRGPALAELAFEEFAQPIVHRLEEQRLAALEARIEAELAVGDHGAVLPELESLCVQHPLREHLWAMRMVALYRAGRQADALRAYSTIRTALVEELGVEPGPELREAETMVLAHDASLAARPPAPADTSRAGNVTTHLDRFVGREQECRQLAELLAAERLVTLVGPGGVGKTRLATEVGVELRERVRDGVWFVDLTSVSGGEGVAAAVATTVADLLGGTAPDTGAIGASAIARLAGSLTGSAPVLVVDNCEHVVDDAALVCQELLERVPGLRVLATSREALGVPGERVVVVPPLERSAAAELFVDRSGRAAGIGPVGDEPNVIDQICERLDDLPLAIELAASRTRALPLDEIEARLGDRFHLLTGGARTAQPRQRTLRSVVDWSHDLLDDTERVVFARLSVFAQPARLEAVEAVVGDDRVPVAAVADLVARLVDKSLVVRVDRPDGVRYGQLQTLRLYAGERLDELDDGDTVRDRHARWFLGEARRAARGLVGVDGPAWRVRVRDEIGDLHRALDWFASRGERDSAIALVNGLAWSWFLAGEWHEGIRWFGRALACDGPDDERCALARQWRAYFAVFADPHPQTLVEAREAYATLRTARSHGRRRAAGLLFASTLNRLGQFDEALVVLLDTRTALGADDDWGFAMCDLLTANATIRLGDLDAAEEAAAASARRFERLGDRSVLIEALGLLAQLATIRGDLDEGVRRYTDLVERSRDLDLPGYLVFWLIARGIVHLRRVDVEAAADDLGAAAARSSNPVNTAAALLGAARAAALHGGAADSELARAADLIDRIEHTDGRRAVLALQGLDQVERGELEEAAAIADHLDADGSGACTLVRAAIAVAEDDVAAAVRHLSRFDVVREQAIGGNFGGLLAAEHDRLSALVAS